MYRTQKTDLSNCPFVRSSCSFVCANVARALSQLHQIIIVYLVKFFFFVATGEIKTNMLKLCSYLHYLELRWVCCQWSCSSFRCTDSWQYTGTCDCYRAYLHWWQEHLLVWRFHWSSLSTDRTALGCLLMYIVSCLQADRSTVLELAVYFLGQLHLHNVIHSFIHSLIHIYLMSFIFSDMYYHNILLTQQ